VAPLVPSCAAFENTADIGPAQVIPTHAGNVVGRIHIKIHKEPQAFEGNAEMLWFDPVRHEWLIMDEKIYRKHNLPKNGWMKPFLESYCVRGKWRMQMRFHGITQDGSVVHTQKAYWPGPGPKKYFRIRRCD